MKPARWILPESCQADAEVLSRRLNVTVPAARVLWHRGYRDAEAARRFLHPALADLHDPFLMRDMERASARLASAIQRRERILLYGDYDVDGSTSIVILKKTIELADGQASFHVPDRLGEGYGMRPEVIERAASNGVSLIVSVDTGIRASESVARAAELGVDVIVTDHHLPKDRLPPAFAVVNPNRPDCGYPDKHLCGAGVAFKLIQAVTRTLAWPDERARRFQESLLKMVSIATVADVVPLVGENRIFVKHGLDGLRVVRNIGLQALLDVSGFSAGQRPTAGQVAFRLAPRINAAGRMASASDVVELFLTGDPARARRLASQLHELNHERQQTELGIVEAILADCERQPVTDDQSALVFAGEGWHRGVVGIVASRLVERFHRPVFVLSLDSESDMAQGSGRSIPAFHLLDCLEANSEILIRFGGHRQAAGLTLSAARIPEFRERITAWAATRLSVEDFHPLRLIDARIELEELNDRSAADLLALEPFGMGNPTPLLMAEDVLVEREPIPFAEKHLRVALRQGARSFWMKAWNANGDGALAIGATGSAVFAVEDDQFSAARGYPGWSLVLKEFRPAAP